MKVRRRAFTLIELLVVIAILAMILGLLVPSLARARKQTQSVMCLTHLRQLSHGWHMYADDNNDVSLPGRFAKLPGGTSNPDNWFDVGNGLKYRPRWVATMGKYVGVFAFSRPRTDYDRQDYDSKVYRCPAVAGWNDERNYAYGYNHQFLGNARKSAGRFHNFPVNCSRIGSFASTVLAGDCLGTAAGIAADSRRRYQNDGTDVSARGNHGWTLDPPRLTSRSDRGSGDPGSPRTGLDPRHLEKANVIFCDGHGETVPPRKIGYRFLPNGAVVDTELVESPPTNATFSGSSMDEDPPELPRS